MRPFCWELGVENIMKEDKVFWWDLLAQAASDLKYVEVSKGYDCERRDRNIKGLLDLRAWLYEQMDSKGSKWMVLEFPRSTNGVDILRGKHSDKI